MPNDPKKEKSRKRLNNEPRPGTKKRRHQAEMAKIVPKSKANVIPHILVTICSASIGKDVVPAVESKILSEM